MVFISVLRYFFCPTLNKDLIIIIFLFLIRNRNAEKQPSWGVLRKRFSENMKQIYRRKPMQICCIFSEELFIRTPLNSCFWILVQLGAVCRSNIPNSIEPHFLLHNCIILLPCVALSDLVPFVQFKKREKILLHGCF